MKYTFIYENDNGKTISLSFDGDAREHTIFRHFLDFMKAVGHDYEKTDTLKIVKENSFRDPFYGAIPPNYDLLNGISGISGEDFNHTSSHGHGMRGPLVGPADC